MEDEWAKALLCLTWPQSGPLLEHLFCLHSAFSCKVFGHPSSNISWAVWQCSNLVEIIWLKGTTLVLDLIGPKIKMWLPIGWRETREPDELLLHKFWLLPRDVITTNMDNYTEYRWIFVKEAQDLSIKRTTLAPGRQMAIPFVNGMRTTSWYNPGVYWLICRPLRSSISIKCLGLSVPQRSHPSCLRVWPGLFPPPWIVAWAADRLGSSYMRSSQGNISGSLCYKAPENSSRRWVLHFLWMILWMIFFYSVD